MIDVTLLIDKLPYLMRGVTITLQIALFGCVIGLSLGTLFGLLQTSRSRIARICVGTYVTLFRGTPMLIQILFAVFVLPTIGIHIPTLCAVILAIGLNSGAYITNIVRAGISSVGRGQIEAGKVLGLSTWQITRYIVLPQALRVALPALGNEFITLVKDSSLASVVGIMELSKRGKIIMDQTLDALTVYTAVALLYLVITSTLSLLVYYLQRRMNIHVRD